MGTIIVSAFILLALPNCGRNTTKDCTLNGEDCHTVEVGPAGKDGTDGKDGKDGAQGPKGDRGEIGPPGATGAQGTAGSNGTNGYSVVYAQLASAPGCTNGGHTLMLGVDVNRNGALDVGTDTSIQSMEICNGQDGEDGEDGQDAAPTSFTPTALVNPCGDAPSIIDEIFLKLANGMLIASMSDNANGQNTRFSVLTPGTYRTTDGDNCTFTVNNSNQITNESHQN